MLWNIVDGTASLLDKKFLIILGVYLKLLIIKLKLKKLRLTGWFLSCIFQRCRHGGGWWLGLSRLDFYQYHGQMQAFRKRGFFAVKLLYTMEHGIGDLKGGKWKWESWYIVRTWTWICLYCILTHQKIECMLINIKIT